MGRRRRRRCLQAPTRPPPTLRLRSPVRPVLTEFSAFGVPWPVTGYGACVAVAVVLALWLWLRQVIRAGLDPGAAAAVAGPMLGAGFLGAYLLSSAVVAARTGDLVTALSAPSVAFYGGALGGLAGAVLCCRVFGFSPGALADAAVEPLALGHALGRVGCLLGGCCYGLAGALPWAVRGQPGTPMGSLLRHPVQLYEAAGLLTLAFVFWRWWPVSRQALIPGVRFGVYGVAYAGLRFGIEFGRADADRGVWALGLSTSQWISIAIVLAAAASCGVPAVAGLRYTQGR